MKIRVFTYSLVVAASALLFGVCKKVDDTSSTCSDNPGVCQSVLEAKDYFAFKVGSWWVYEEENSGERDSVYVTASNIDPDGYNFDVRMYSTYQDFYYHYWPEYYNANGCSETEPIAKKCLYIKRSKYQFGNYIGESICFFVRYNIGQYVTTGSGLTYCQNNRIIVDNIFDDYSLSDLSFQKTIVIHELCSYIEGQQSTNHYYSKGVGLVRKELIDSAQVWNLVNYYIEP